MELKQWLAVVDSQKSVKVEGRAVGDPKAYIEKTNVHEAVTHSVATLMREQPANPLKRLSELIAAYGNSKVESNKPGTYKPTNQSPATTPLPTPATGVGSNGGGTASAGVVGLGVMGSQLTLNLAEKLGEEISAFDLDAAKVASTSKLAKVPAQWTTTRTVGPHSMPAVMLLLSTECSAHPLHFPAP
jgi:hypothetical protein